MRIEASARDRQVLRLALGAGLAFTLAGSVDDLTPFLAVVLYVTLAGKLPAPLPFGKALTLLAMLTLIPLALWFLIRICLDFPLIEAVLIAVVLFAAARLPNVGAGALVRFAVITFAVVLPILAATAEVVPELLVALMAQSTAIALVTSWVAFALFSAAPPARPATGAPPPPADDGLRNRRAIADVIVLMPILFIFVELEMNAALRVIITVTTILIEMRDEIGASVLRETLVANALGGAAAVAVGQFAAIFPVAPAVMLVTVLVSLWFAAKAVDAGARGGLWIVALVTLWILIGGPGDENGLSIAAILERLLMVGGGGLYTATMLALTAPLRRPSRQAAEGPAAAL